MSLEDVLSTAVTRGVTFLLEGDELAYRAPKGAMTKELRDAVVSHKQELIAALKRAHAEKGEAPIPRSELPDTEPAPLSPGQERLWLIDRLTGPSPLYNVHLRMEWTGPLDLVALQRAIDAVVSRHASLRTTFREIDGQPRAIVSEGAALRVTYRDLRHLVPDVKPRALELFAREQRRAPFDLARGPLLRIGVVTLEDDEHALLFTQHHIVTDAWSVGLFFTELGDELKAAGGGERRARPSALRYSDYARWQEARRTRPGWEESLAWARSRLEGLPRLELPYACHGAIDDRFAGDAYTFTLGPSVTARLKELARAQRCTLYVVLSTAWAVLLHRMTGQATFAIGTVSSGRGREELRDVIGFFANTLAVRSDLSGDPVVTVAMDRLRTEIDATLAREVPFGDVVDAVGGARGASLNPLIQACLVFENATVPAGNAAASRASRYRIAPGRPNASIEGTAKFDLELVLKEEGEGLAASLEYAVSLFDADTIERMIGYFCALVEDMAARPGAAISELRMATARELPALRGDATRVPSAFATRPFHELFEQQVVRAPDEVALVTAEERLTYRELDARANRLAHRLKALGVGPDTLVGLWLAKRDAGLIVGMLGIAKAGGAYVPLDPRQPAIRNQALVADANLRFLVTEAALADAQTTAGAACVKLDADAAALAAEPSHKPPCAVDASHLAYVIFTSGSTGKPKGVAVEHRTLAHYIAAIGERLALPSAASYAHVSTFAADLGHTSVFCPLSTGGTMHLVEQQVSIDSDAMGRYFAAHAVDCLKIVPSHLAALLGGAHPERVLPRKLLVVAGEALTWDLVSRIRELAPSLRIINSYGPTETTVGVVTCEVGERAAAAGAATVPIGLPLSGTRAYVVDHAMKPVPIGVRGELWIGGAQVARGYVGRPEATAERFIDDPFSAEPGARVYKTGDIVRRRGSGDLEFLGRSDHQLKIRGFRVEPGEIEATLSQHASVRACVVLPCRAGGEGEPVRLVAYVVAEAKVEELREHLKERLPDHMVPSFFVLLDAMPLGANGKIDRASLPAPAAPAPAGDRAPRTPTELLVARAWQEVLRIDRVDTSATFADLGGHSLLMMRVHARLRELLESPPPLSMLLDHPTIQGLARAVDARSARRGLAASASVAGETNALGPRLVELRAGAPDRAPLFLVHQAGGIESAYFTLATCLEPNQPLHAIRASEGGLDSSVERLAARYIELVRARSPRGPYFLGGASFGGLVAYEMAQQLRHQNEAVGPVFLIDTEPPGRDVYTPRTNEEILAFLRAMAPELVDLLLLPRASRPPGLIDLFPECEAFLANFRECSALRTSHAPRPYDGDVVFLRAGDRSGSASARPDEGWRTLVRGKLTLVDVPGNHITMLQNPHVAMVAGQLSAHIAGRTLRKDERERT